MTLGEVLTMGGYLVGALVFWLSARRRHVATEGFALLALAALCGGVFGAKLVQWLIAADTGWWQHPLGFFDVRNGGRTIVGGLAGGWLAVELAKKRLGITRSTGDLFAFALPAGETIGRIGCYFNGCCYGKACSVPWAIYQHGAWRHPTQLYAAALSAAIFAMMWSRRDRWRHEGDAWKACLILWVAARFFVEAFREHAALGAILSTAQYACLVLMALGFTLLARSYRTVQATA